MNKDILEYLKINSEKIKRLEKDEKVVKHNLTNNMHTWIKGYTDEMKYANEDRKRTLKREIENIGQDIIDTEEKVSKEYDSKKKVVLSDSVHKIEEFVGELFDDVVHKINEGKNNLDGLKQEINKNSMSGNFDDVIILAAQAKKSETALSELNTLKDNVTSIINRITETLANMDNISFADAKSEYDSYMEDISKLSTDFDFDFDFNSDPKPGKENIEEILYYLDIANNSNFNEEKRRQALDIAYSLTNELEDEELKESLFTDLASAYDAIKKDSEPIIDPDYEYAKQLVEKAEQTEKAKDFVKALESLDKVSEEKRDELARRLKKLSKKNDNKVKILLEELKKQKDDSKKLDKDKLLELEDRYKYISNDLEEQIKEDFEELIIYNNNFIQNEYKQNYQLKKDNFFTMVGKALSFVKGSKIATKFNLKKLSKIKSMVADAEDEDEKEYLEQKYLKVSNKLIANSIVGGVRLFVAKKRLEKLKPKLYSGEGLTEKQIKRFNKSIKVIDKNMNKGLNAKTKVEVEDKAYITSIVDQYLYLISTGENIDETTKAFEEYLEKIKNKLTDAEYNAICDQLYIIHDYRLANDNAIYEIKSDIADDEITTELDDVVKYYDSEECKIGFRQAPIYIKR